MAARKKKSAKKKSSNTVPWGGGGSWSVPKARDLNARLNAVIAKESRRVGRSGVLKQALDAQIEMKRLAAIKPKAHAKQMMKQLENKIPLPILERRLAKLSQVVSNRHAWIARFGK